MQRDSTTQTEGSSAPMRPCLRMRPELRLKDGTRIRAILDQGQRAAGERILLVAMRNDLGHARLACVVGRRFDKRAVVRNLWRRRVREVFRTTRQVIEADDAGWDWVAVALKREGGVVFERLLKDFANTAQRARRAAPGSARRDRARKP